MQDEQNTDTSASDSALGELTSEFLGPEQETAQPTQEATAQEPAKATEAQPEAVPAPAPRVNIDGKEYDQEALKAALTTASQFGHLQQKYTQLLERSRTEPTKAEPAQPEKGIPADQIVAHYAPQVKETVAQGFIEEDFAALYPSVAANMVMYRDVITGLTRVANVVAEKLSTQDRSQFEQGVISELKQSFTQLASQGDLYKPLSEPKVQEAFFLHLLEMNPQIEVLRSPGFLERQWKAFNIDTILSRPAAQASAPAAAKPASNVKRANFARGEGTGARPAAPTVEDRTQLQDFVAEFFGSGR